MEAMKKITEKMVKAFKEEYGEDAIMEDGDTVAGVFNDCVCIIEKDDLEMKINIIVGEPYKFDENAFEES